MKARVIIKRGLLNTEMMIDKVLVVIDKTMKSVV